jgi:hypothetical protein
VVSLKIRLLNTLGSAPVIPPQWRNDRGPSLKIQLRDRSIVPKAVIGLGQKWPVFKYLRYYEMAPGC